MCSADMLTGSLMTNEAVELERKVILEEIGMYEDSPDELIHEMAQVRYLRGRWGNGFWAPPESISHMTREEIVGYVGGRYTVPNTIVAVAGSFNPTRLLHGLEKGFSAYPATKPQKTTCATVSALTSEHHRAPPSRPM